MDSPAPKIHLPHWLQAIVASAGGLGLFLIAFLDSSVLTFPVINDLLLIDLSIRYPARMPYYAAMATLGSVAGCLLLYYLARKGGEAMFHKHAGPRARKYPRLDQAERLRQHFGDGAAATSELPSKYL